MIIPVKKLSKAAKLPERATNGAIGFDPYALRVLSVDGIKLRRKRQLPFDLLPGHRTIIGTGISIVIPFPYQCEVRPRAGLADKYGIMIVNGPGTVDPDFRGELGILLYNSGKEIFTVQKNMRIAQLIFSKTEVPIMKEVKALPSTLRNTGGFGSTGLWEISEGTAAYKRQIFEIDKYFMNLAIETSNLSNCARGCKKGRDGRYLLDKKGRLIGQTRKFGCLIVKNGTIIATGYNAQVAGQELCAQVGCLRDNEKIPSGTLIERCRAVHAEEMAISNMIANGVGTTTAGATMYCTSEPCQICAKTIAQSKFEALVVLADVYPKNGVKIVEDAGVEVRMIKKSDLEE